MSENNEVECGLEAAVSFVREVKWSIRPRSAAKSPQSVLSQDLCYKHVSWFSGGKTFSLNLGFVRNFRDGGVR